MTDLSNRTTRDTLPVRSEPHWQRITTGYSLGYRRTDSGNHTWVALYRMDCEKKSHKLGREATMTHAQAMKEANKFFSACEKGSAPTALTVEDACRAYVDDRRMMKGEACAADADKRFVSRVYGKEIGKVKLNKLRSTHVTKWRDEISANGKSAANRNLRSLKAALNFAHRQKMVPDADAWSVVKLFPNADRARTLMLPAVDRKEFAMACPGWCRALLLGLSATGARPGELRAATVGDVDVTTRTLRLVTRKGASGQERIRDFPLANEKAFKFMAKQAGDRPSHEPLFLNSKGEQIAEAVLSTTVKRVRRKHGWDDRLCAYSYRHGAISEWLAAGIPVAAVAKMCGTSIDKISTNYSKYISSTIDDQVAAVAML